MPKGRTPCGTIQKILGKLVVEGFVFVEFGLVPTAIQKRMDDELWDSSSPNQNPEHQRGARLKGALIFRMGGCSSAGQTYFMYK